MKNLNTITIGNITALTVLKTLTVISLVSYLLFVVCIGFFSLEAFISFLLFVGLFLICTHRPANKKKKELIFNLSKNKFAN